MKLNTLPSTLAFAALLAGTSSAFATIGGDPVQEGNSILRSTVYLLPVTLDFQKLANSLDAVAAASCTGSVISNHFILTAGHCVSSMKLDALFSSTEKISVIPAKPSMTAALINSDGIVAERGQFKAHRYYDFTMMVGPMTFQTNDIGLIYVPQDLSALGLKPIKVFEGTKPSVIAARKKLNVAGYGDGVYDLIKGVVLKEDRVGYSMKKYQSPTDSLPMEIVTAQSKKHGTQPGDSGGPLYFLDNAGNPVQVGITSHGLGKKEAASTFVPSYKSWIETTMSELANTSDKIDWVNSI